MKERAMVVKVDKDRFKLSDGRVFEHPEPLDDVPTIEEFQKIYDSWRTIFRLHVDGSFAIDGAVTENAAPDDVE